MAEELAQQFGKHSFPLFDALNMGFNGLGYNERSDSHAARPARIKRHLDLPALFWRHVRGLAHIASGKPINESFIELVIVLHFISPWWIGGRRN